MTEQQTAAIEAQLGGRHAHELDRRMTAVGRAIGPQERARLLELVRDAIAAEMSSDTQLADEFVRAEIEHRRWQAIHRYVRAVPYRDDFAAPRPRQWQGAMAVARDLGDLDLIEWVVAQIDRAHAEAARRKTSAPAESGTEPTYLVLLKAVANNKRKARAALAWTQTAREKGWITCTSGTLGENLLALHAASVHSRDNPDYVGPVDGPYIRD